MWRVSSACCLSADEHKPHGFPNKCEMLFVNGLGGKAAATGVGMLLSHSPKRVPVPGTSALPGQSPPSGAAAFLFFSFLFSFFFCVLRSSSEGFGVAEKIVLLTFISAVILMAILGNLLVMVAVCRDRQLR